MGIAKDLIVGIGASPSYFEDGGAATPIPVTPTPGTPTPQPPAAPTEPSAQAKELSNTASTMLSDMKPQVTGAQGTYNQVANSKKCTSVECKTYLSTADTNLQAMKKNVSDVEALQEELKNPNTTPKRLEEIKARLGRMDIKDPRSSAGLFDSNIKAAARLAGITPTAAPAASSTNCGRCSDIKRRTYVKWYAPDGNCKSEKWWNNKRVETVNNSCVCARCSKEKSHTWVEWAYPSIGGCEDDPTAFKRDRKEITTSRCPAINSPAAPAAQKPAKTGFSLRMSNGPMMEMTTRDNSRETVTYTGSYRQGMNWLYKYEVVCVRSGNVFKIKSAQRTKALFTSGLTMGGPELVYGFNGRVCE
jgi:hypothetical protein